MTNKLETLDQRLNYAFKESGMKKIELARAIGESPQLINRLCTSTVHATKHATALADALNINLRWLVSGDGPMYNVSDKNVKALQKQYATIPIVDFKHIDEYLVNHADHTHVSGMIYAKNDGLSRFSIRMPDTSMAPLIKQNGCVILDPNKTTLMDDDIALIYVSRMNQYLIRLFQNNTFIPIDKEFYKNIDISHADIIAKMTAYHWEEEA